MPKTKVCFRITINFQHPTNPGSTSNGIIAKSGLEVDEIGSFSGLKVTGAEFGRQIDVDLDEKDPRLAKLYEAIWEKYRLKPSRWNIIPKAEQRNYFGVRRKVTWTKKEIDACELLWLRHKLTIANNRDATPEQWQKEEYVAGVDETQRS